MNYNKEIEGLRAMAKQSRNFTDDELGLYCGISGGTIRNKASKKELTTLKFETVATIAKLAGYEIEFRRVG